MPWTITYPPALSIIEDQSGTLWITGPDGVFLLFPAISITLVGGPSIWLLEQTTPPYPGLNRDLQLEGLGPNGWYAMWQGNESDLPIQINLQNLPFSNIRARYTLANGCEYVIGGSTIIPEPDECGILTSSINLASDCVTQQFTLTLEITATLGYPLGNIVVTVDGEEVSSQPASIGTFVLGPYSTVSTVDEVRITNTADSECDVTYGPFSIEVDCDCPPDEVVNQVILCDSIVNALSVTATGLTSVYIPYGEQNGETQYEGLGLPNSPIVFFDGANWAIDDGDGNTYVSDGDQTSPLTADWTQAGPFAITVVAATAEQVVLAGGKIEFTIVNPQEGDAYAVGGCSFAWPPNSIQTWDGSNWVTSSPAQNDIIEDSDGTQWQFTGGQFVQRFPIVNLQWSPSTMVFTSEFQATHQALGRQVRIEVEFGLGQWQTVYEGPEGVLSDPFPVENPFGEEIELLSIRTTYIVGPCEYPQDGESSSLPSCLTAAYTVEFACDIEDALTCRSANRVFILSDNNNFGVYPLGSIVEGGLVVATPLSGEPVYASTTDDWWVQTPFGPGSLFPRLDITHVEDSLDITFTSQYPGIHAHFQRNFLLEGSQDGQTWDEVASGNESQLTLPLNITMDNPYYGFRLSYQYSPGCDSADIFEQIELDIPIMLVLAQQETGTRWTMWRSYNQGPWSSVLEFSQAPFGGLAQTTRSHPLDSDKLAYAGRIDIGGIRVSQDRGRTWQVATGNWTDPWPAGVTVPRRGWNQVSYAEDGSVWCAGPLRITRSVDGLAFNDVVFPTDLIQLPDPEPPAICAISADIAIVGGKGTNRLYFTEDGGATWQQSVNVSGRDFVSESFNRWPNIIHLGGGRVLAFSNSIDSVYNPTGPAWVVISNDYGRTFVSWSVTSLGLIQSQQALQVYGWNDGPTVLGRAFAKSLDAGDTWERAVACSTPPGRFASFLINKRFYTGVGKFQSPFNDENGNGYTEDGGWTFKHNPNVFPVSGLQGIPALAPASFGWPLLPKPRLGGIVPEENFFMFDVTGDASGGFISAQTSTGFFTLKSQDGAFEVGQFPNNISDPSALSGLYTIYSSDAFGNPAGVITYLAIADVPSIPIDFSQLPALLVAEYNSNGWSEIPAMSASSALSTIDASSGTGIAATQWPDLSAYPDLVLFTVNYSNTPSTPSFEFNPIISQVQLDFGAFASVDQLFIDIEAHGTSGGSISVRFGTSAAPTSASLAARTALLSRGWTILTN